MTCSLEHALRIKFIQHLELMIKLLLISLPFTCIVFTATFFDGLLDGGAIFFGKTLSKITEPLLDHFSKAIG